MPKNVDELVARNNDAKRLLAAGFSIMQSQGPDYDENGDVIVYKDDDGNPVDHPPIVWWVQLCDSTGQRFMGTYVADDDTETWNRLGCPEIIESVVKQMQSNDPNHSTKLSDDDAAKLAYAAAVATGELTQKEADDSYAEVQNAAANPVSAEDQQLMTVGELEKAINSLPDNEPITKADLLKAIESALA